MPVPPETDANTNSTATLAPNNSSAITSPQQFAQLLLARLGLPVTKPNIDALVAWQRAEGGHWHNTAHFNPLNTTQTMPGATSMNSVGVKSYVSWDQGIDATVKTLRYPAYAGILRALSNGNDPVGVVRAVNASPWGTKSDFSGLLGKGYTVGATPVGADAPPATAPDDSAKCDSGKAIVKIPMPSPLSDLVVLNECQGKAVLGALILIAGAVTMLGGLVLVMAVSRPGQRVASAVGRTVGGPYAAALGAIRGPDPEEQQARDTRAAERSARMATAQDRQERAEARSMQRARGNVIDSQDRF